MVEPENQADPDDPEAALRVVQGPLRLPPVTHTVLTYGAFLVGREPAELALVRLPPDGADAVSSMTREVRRRDLSSSRGSRDS